MLERLIEMICEVIGDKQITLETDFVKDLELSSLDIADIISYIEQVYNITINPRELRKIHRVKDAIMYLEKLGIYE